jgi:hypothetical protein
MPKFPEGHRLFYLEEIGEPSDNVLRIVVIEAGAQGPAQSTLVGEAVPILPLPDAVPLELVWEHYIAYAVRNESYAKAEDRATWSPPVSQLIERRNSAFLDFLMRTTIASDEFPGPLRHWELTCLNHVIDVVSTSEPLIALRRAHEPA